MQQAWKPERDHLVAAGLAIVVQVFVFGALGSQLLVEVHREHARPLQLQWIAVIPAPPPAVRPDTPAARAPAARANGLPNPSNPPDGATAVSTQAPSLPVHPLEILDAKGSHALTAVYVGQVAQWAEQNPVAIAPGPDPLTRRAAGFSKGPPDRFRMKHQVTPADVAGFVGVLFGGAGYTANPCPEMRRNVNALAQDGDSELLQDELARERSLCW